MTTTFPHRCLTCEKLVHTASFQEAPKCCPEAKFERIVSICLLIPATEKEEVVLTSKRVANLVDRDTRWKVACGKGKLPEYYTDQPIAVTCGKCLKYLKDLYSELGLDFDKQPDSDDLQELDITVQFEDEENPPPNPFDTDV